MAQSFRPRLVIVVTVLLAGAGAAAAAAGPGVAAVAAAMVAAEESVDSILAREGLRVTITVRDLLELDVYAPNWHSIVLVETNIS